MSDRTSYIFAELRLGRSYLRYLSNGKLTYQGKDGKKLFAAVMGHVNLFGRDNPLPSMVAVHKAIPHSYLDVHWKHRPVSPLSKILNQMSGASSAEEKEEFHRNSVLEAENSAQEIEWELARRLMSNPQVTPKGHHHG